ncbi:MAG: hypothetical protein EON54_02610 [Alcaligenaceae bacterium]|nr:MAG: hypothetical protein EON54_02610 [Alcaligenaceae bacterium]
MSEVQTGFTVSRDSVGNQVLSYREARGSNYWKAYAVFFLALFVLMPVSCVAAFKAGDFGPLVPIVVGVAGVLLTNMIIRSKRDASIKLTRSSVYTSEGRELSFSNITNLSVATSNKWDCLKANYQGNVVNITQHVDHGMGSALQSTIQSWITKQLTE